MSFDLKEKLKKVELDSAAPRWLSDMFLPTVAICIRSWVKYGRDGYEYVFNGCSEDLALLTALSHLAMVGVRSEAGRQFHFSSHMTVNS